MYFSEKKTIKTLKSKEYFKFKLQSLQDRYYLRFSESKEKHSQKVPNFLIIGAMKAGTTSLHHSLNYHPDIYMSSIKEPDFFLDHPLYLKRFPYIQNKESLLFLMLKRFQGESYFGESSTAYTNGPEIGLEAPKNIRNLNPQMKIIYILRNPFARIHSHYFHCLQRQIYSENLNSILERDPTFLNRSLYFYQISRYLPFFDKKQIHILLFEEWIKTPTTLLQNIFRFLEVDPFKEIKIKFPHENKGFHFKSFSPKISPLLYERYHLAIREDVQKMEEFLGRSLDLWDLSPKKWC